MNYSYSSGIQPTLLESYLNRRALENVEPSLGYLNDAVMVEQPKNNGKHVKFFRYTELPAVDKPLYEGVTPDPQLLTETAFSVMTKQYGAWMDFTDEIDLWHVDSKTQAMSDRLNRQARLTIDNVGRDAICAGLNVMFPGTVAARGSIGSTDLINYTMIKKAVRNLPAVQNREVGSVHPCFLEAPANNRLPVPRRRCHQRRQFLSFGQQYSPVFRNDRSVYGIARTGGVYLQVFQLDSADCLYSLRHCAAADLPLGLGVRDFSRDLLAGIRRHHERRDACRSADH